MGTAGVSEPSRQGIGGVSGKWPSIYPDYGATRPCCRWPHLDHIYLDHELRIEKAHFHRNWLSLAASDHLPLVAEVAFRRHR